MNLWFNYIKITGLAKSYGTCISLLNLYEIRSYYFKWILPPSPRDHFGSNINHIHWKQNINTGNWIISVIHFGDKNHSFINAGGIVFVLVIECRQFLFFVRDLWWTDHGTRFSGVILSFFLSLHSNPVYIAFVKMRSYLRHLAHWSNNGYFQHYLDTLFSLM